MLDLAFKAHLLALGEQLRREAAGADDRGFYGLGDSLRYAAEQAEGWAPHFGLDSDGEQQRRREADDVPF
jgi:hypothetical protein